MNLKQRGIQKSHISSNPVAYDFVLPPEVQLPRSTIDFRWEEIDNTLVLSMDGKLDQSSTPTLQIAMKDILKSNAKAIVFNLQNLTLVDSSGIGSIVSAIKKVSAQGGCIKIAQLSEQPKEIFKILNLDKVLPIYDSIEEAIQAF